MLRVKTKARPYRPRRNGRQLRYSVFADVNADGIINALDLGFVKAHPYRPPPSEPGPMGLLFGTNRV